MIFVFIGVKAFISFSLLRQSDFLLEQYGGAIGMNSSSEFLK
jgi:hypothetical protein